MPPVRRHWRSLAEAAGDPEFLARAAQEFPGLAEALAEPTGRRRALQLMAASLAMAGVAGCGSPGTAFDQMTVAPVAAPNIIPALPNYYATVSLFAGYAEGVVVKQVMGRPIKVEGNPNHPASLGASSVHAQAMLLDFYDPARAASIAHGNAPTDRQALEWALLGERNRLAAGKGAGFRILTGSFTSPTLGAQITALLQQYPQARWHQWDAISRAAVSDGAALAYGRPVETILHPAAADVILGIDSDLLDFAPGHVRLAREFASRRNPTRTKAMSRVFSVEATPGLLGTAADHHFVAGPAELHQIVTGLAAGVLHNAASSAGPDWLAPVIAELQRAEGRALVHAGPDQPAETHALAHAMNEALGGRGRTFDVIDSVTYPPADPAAQSLRALADDMHAGRVDTLVMVGVNPVFAAPPTLGFREALGRVRFSLALAAAPDETAVASTWFAPEVHSFEGWSDARAYDGTASIVQPQALPLWGAISAHEMLDLLARPFPRSPLALVRETWREHMASDADRAWRDALANGVIAGTGSAKADVKLRGEAANMQPPAPPDRKLHLLFRPDPNLWDGRYANNPWLHELPRPLTKLVWDNPLLIPPGLATAMHLANGDVVEVAAGQARTAAPVWIVPGQAPDCVTALLGFGRRVVGQVGADAGFDFYPLRGQDAAPTLRKTGRRYELASTDHHNPLDVSPEEIVLHGTLPDFEQHPYFLHQQAETPTLYHRPKLAAQAWGMSVDLNACIGCNACVLACVAENNTPVVGKQQVLHEREMHWLRIDRYYTETPDGVDVAYQPMLCQHCGNAPCEAVCPVLATVHSEEGLNQQVYNRCVGTRYCANNCPYKVRRFNWFDYAHDDSLHNLVLNPDVTVRSRGVMEKCTFCVQRIQEAKIEAGRQELPVSDGDIRTACQQSCPTQAIVFGDLNDPKSRVSRLAAGPRAYRVLEELNVKPSVNYLSLVRNRPAAEDKRHG